MTTKREDQATVLVVNDMPDALQMMSALLGKAGYHVLAADNSQQGWEIAQRERPQLVISNVVMPEISGIELCRRIRADAALRTTPILLLSALRADSESAVEGLEAGADDYLETPFDPPLLMAKAERLIERARSEAALREADERYRLLVEGVQEYAILMMSTEGRITSWNSGAERIYGYRTEEVKGKHISILLPPECHDEELRIIERIKRGEHIERYETVRVSKDGTHIPVSLTVSPVKNLKGQLAGISKIAYDITERRALEEQLRQSQKLEGIGKLAGGIVHDFNNLLTIILGQSQLIMRRLAENNSTRARVEEIKKAGEQAAGLTRQLLAFSRKQIVEPKVIDLNDAVMDADNLLRRLIGEDIQLMTMRDPVLGRVKADPIQVGQIIINLAVNARDAMPEGGKLTIETKNVTLDEAYARKHISIRPGGYVMLAVSDTGHGMDDETQKRIFEPFFTTKEAGKGTGLGLSTVYGIVKQSGGNVWVYSEVGHGTTFKVYLPMVEEDVTLEPNTVAPVPRGTETVLVVEDNEAVRELTRNILEAEGYAVFTARHGGEALRICEQHEGTFHLLVTDVVMPEMSGRQLAERFSRRCAGAGVLYMSGYADHAIVHHGVLEAGTNFIQKPFTPDTLARKVREVLDANRG